MSGRGFRDLAAAGLHVQEAFAVRVGASRKRGQGNSSAVRECKRPTDGPWRHLRMGQASPSRRSWAASFFAARSPIAGPQGGAHVPGSPRRRGQAVDAAGPGPKISYGMSSLFAHRRADMTLISAQMRQGVMWRRRGASRGDGQFGWKNSCVGAIKAHIPPVFWAGQHPEGCIGGRFRPAPQGSATRGYGRRARPKRSMTGGGVEGMRALEEQGSAVQFSGRDHCGGQAVVEAWSR
jgi:hypothetical protein